MLLQGPTEGNDAHALPVQSGRSAIHLSALIACATYIAGAVVAGFQIDSNPVLVRGVLTFGVGDDMLVLAFVAFLIITSLIQRHMGISLRASTTRTPCTLCTTGPFRYSRNPIYLAFLLPLAAFSYFSVFAAAVSIGFYVLAITYFVVRDEERVLKEKFGAAFDEYAQRTPRWLLF